MLDMSKDNNRFEEMGKESQFQKRKKKKDQAYDKNNQKEHRI